MIELNLFVNSVFARGLAQVIQDRWTISDRLRFLPRFEAVTKCVHVTVRANTRITEEIPSATHAGTTFQDRVTTVGTLLLQVIGHANT